MTICVTGFSSGTLLVLTHYFQLRPIVRCSVEVSSVPVVEWDRDVG